MFEAALKRNRRLCRSVWLLEVLAQHVVENLIFLEKLFPSLNRFVGSLLKSNKPLP